MLTQGYNSHSGRSEWSNVCQLCKRFTTACGELRSDESASCNLRRNLCQVMLYMCYRLHFCYGLIAVNIVTCPDHSTPTVPEGHILSNGLWRKIAHSVDLSERLKPNKIEKSAQASLYGRGCVSNNSSWTECGTGTGAERGTELPFKRLTKAFSWAAWVDTAYQNISVIKSPFSEKQERNRSNSVKSSYYVC